MSFTSPTTYNSEPSSVITVLTCGREEYLLTIPQVGLYYYRLLPINSPEYEAYFRCNSFLMFRRTVQKALRINSNEASAIAGDCWYFAPFELREFFKNYTQSVLSFKNKIFKIKNNKPKAHKSKKKLSGKNLTATHEVLAGEHLNENVNTFEFVK